MDDVVTIKLLLQESVCITAENSEANPEAA